ncbi:MAG: HAD hydrolase-like protein, partial [Pseudomonadales bacterium]|nr:HAD hydrolase-like protein [Pseudomonadales bacterium]
MHQHCKLIIFDLDDTLWPTRPVLERAERETYQWMQQHAPRITEQYSLQDTLKRRMAFMRERPLAAHKVSEMRVQGYELLALDCGYDSASAARIALEAMEYFLHFRQQVSCFADVEKNIPALAQNYMLGALTNGNADLSRIPIGKFFSFTLAGENLPYAKPHSSAFAAALQKASEHAGEEIGAQ